MAVTGIGYLLMLAGGNLLSWLISLSLSNDIFNSLNETFPQEERFLSNEYSINLPARYNLKSRVRKSWINIINPFRGLLVIGSPGSGKSWFVIQHVIKQHIEKGCAMFVYDFKYDDLSKIVYNWLQQNTHKYSINPSFYVINFDNLSISHRCNPLDPNMMNDITDATESARTILLGLNREWIIKQGDFFVESPINFVTAIIWFLRKYEDGKYCTLPHVIGPMLADYDELFPILNTQPEIRGIGKPICHRLSKRCYGPIRRQGSLCKNWYATIGFTAVRSGICMIELTYFEIHTFFQFRFTVSWLFLQPQKLQHISITKHILWIHIILGYMFFQRGFLVRTKSGFFIQKAFNGSS